MAIKRYIPDIAKHAALCEANFVRFQRLLKDMSENRYQFSWTDNHQNQVDVDIDVVERFKYTTTLSLTKQLHNLPEPINRVSLTVRLYADARMAEVVTLEQGSQLAGVYRYPNDQMYQIDEKEQANHYLAEWLSHLLNHGVTQVEWKPEAPEGR